MLPHSRPKDNREGEYLSDPNTLLGVAVLPISLAEKQLFLLNWQEEQGSQGVNHYWAGAPPIPGKKYCQKYLPMLAVLDHSFKVEEIAR